MFPPSNNPENQQNQQGNVSNRPQNNFNNKINLTTLNCSNNPNNSVSQSIIPTPPTPPNLAAKRGRTESHSPSPSKNNNNNKKRIKENTPTNSTISTCSINNNKPSSEIIENKKNVVQLPISNLQKIILEFLKIVKHYQEIFEKIGKQFGLISKSMSMPYNCLSNNLLNIEKASIKVNLILSKLFDQKEEKEKNIKIEEEEKIEKTEENEGEKLIKKINNNLMKNPLKSNFPPSLLYKNLLKLKKKVATYIPPFMLITENLSLLSTKKAFPYIELTKQLEIIKKDSNEAVNLIKNVFKEDIEGDKVEKKNVEEH